MNNISVIIEQLGGVTYTSDHKTNYNFNELIADLPHLPEKNLIEFIEEYGLSCFNSKVGIIPKQLPPIVTKDDPFCPLGGFFDFGDSDDSVFSIIETYHKEDQIPIDFFPICDGVSGDIILYSLEGKTFGKIYYWHHESALGKDLFLIADSFSEFMDGLKQIEMKVESPTSKGKVTFVSPKMLQLMNKTRADNGLPPMTMEDALG